MLGIGSSRSLTRIGTIGSPRSTPMRQSGMQVPWSSLQPVRQRGLEIVVERGLQQMPPERDMALEPPVRIDLLHERLGRAVVLLADADADRRQIADEEIDPVVGRDHDQQIRPAGREPPSDLVEAGRELVAVGAWASSPNRAR